MKCGLSTDELLKSKNGYIDPLDNKSDAEDNDAVLFLSFFNSFRLQMIPLRIPRIKRIDFKINITNRKQTIDDQRLMDYIADDKLLFKPDGLVCVWLHHKM